MEKILEDSDFGRVLLRKSIRAKSISIRIRSSRPVSGASVIVTVPFGIRYDKGLDFMNRKREWIRKILARQRRRAAEAKENGRAVPVLGNGSIVHTLMSEIMFKATGNRADSGVRKPGIPLKIETESVESEQTTDRLWLSLNRPITRKVVRYPDIPAAPWNQGTPEKHDDTGSGGLSSCTAAPAGELSVNDLLTSTLVKILRDEAKLLLPQKVKLFAERYGFQYRRIAIKHNSSNWGSCSRAGNINLNLNLIRLPEPLCDYVILHELCHLAEPNHGSRFHALLERLCIDQIGRLISLGSPDARKYAAWIPSGQDAAARIDCGNAAPASYLRQSHATGSEPGSGLSHIAGTGSLNLVLSREVSRWHMV